MVININIKQVWVYKTTQQISKEEFEKICNRPDVVSAGYVHCKTDNTFDIEIKLCIDHPPPYLDEKGYLTNPSIDLERFH